MTYRPRATLSRVIDDLGSTLLEVVAGSARPEITVGGVVIHDPLDPPELPRQALVLGVGLRAPQEIAEMLCRLGTAGAAGLIVRVPVDVDPIVTGAVESSGVVLLGLTRGASWAQVVSLLRSSLAVDDLGDRDGERLAGAEAGDLFALAGAVSALLDAPVTIEDLNSRIIAFSSDQGQADESRKETVLGRQVPERFTRELERRGDFRALYGSDEPVYVNITGLEGVDLPRIAVRVRAGDEILGSMWAAVKEPLSTERERAFIDSAKLVALHLLRQRAGADVERRLRAELVATLIEGGPTAYDAAGRLGLATELCCVVAAGIRDSGEPSTIEAELQRISSAFALHLSAVHPRSAVALIGGVVYSVLPVWGEPATSSRAVAIMREFVDRLGESSRLVAGVGRVAAGAAELPRSRADADRALRVLRLGRVADRVARAEDLHVAALLLELGDLMAAEHRQPAGPVVALAAYDRKHRGVMVETLRAWLDAFGDINAAAAALHVHPNTFRYRLRRLAEIGGLDLNDPEVRFAVMLELRLARQALDADSRTE